MANQKIESVGTVFADVSLITEFTFLIIKLTFHFRTRLSVEILNQSKGVYDENFNCKTKYNCVNCHRHNVDVWCTKYELRAR